MSTLLERMVRRLRDYGPFWPDVPANQEPDRFLINGTDARHVMPDNLGPIGEHLVWTLIKGVQQGADVLLIVTSADGKDATRLSLPARKVAP